jgi:Zn-dependent protease with chaperone function
MVYVQADGRVDATVTVFGRKAATQLARDEGDWTGAMGSFLGGPLRETPVRASTGLEEKVGLFQRAYQLAGGVRRDGWVRYLEADPRPALALLRKAGVATVTLVVVIADKQGFSECTLPATLRHGTVPPDVRALDVPGEVDGADDPDDPDVDAVPWRGWFPFGPQSDTFFGRTEAYHYNLPTAEGAVPPFRVSYGYRPENFAVLALLAFLPLPVVLTLWKRRRVTGRPGADPAAAWWGYSRFLRRLEVGLGLFWAIAVMGTSAGPLLDRLAHMALGLSTENRPLFVGWDWLSLAVYALPPAVTGFLCVYLSYPVYTRVRNVEWTRSDIAWHALAGHVAPWFALLLGASMLSAVGNGDLRRCITWGLVFFLGKTVLPRLQPKGGQRSLQALDTGVVRDRVFELAQKAGVKVNQIYLWRSHRDRAANAAAVVGNKVLLSDYLLQHMSKRQVDWVVAHELVHLRHRHPGKVASGGAVWLAVVAFYVLTFYARNMGGLPSGLRVAYDVVMLLRYGLLLALLRCDVWLRTFRMRRYEFVADGEAVAVTGGDAEAGIGALVKLGRLNGQPDDWGRLEEAFSTHPSNSRRIQALVDENDLDPERLPEILAAADRDGDRYPLPADLLQDERRFLTECVARRSSVLQWFSLVFMMLIPALLARGIEALDWRGTAALAAAAGGVVLALLLLRVYLDYAAVWGERRLRTQLGARWKDAGIDAEARGGIFVGLAPSRAPRIFESSFDWDLGYLLPAGDRLCYLGCQTSFALARERIKAVRIGPGAPRWGKSSRVYLTWSDDAGAETTWNLRPAGEISLHAVVRRTPRLLRALENWHGEAPAAESLPEPLSSLPGPAIGKVTSSTLATHLRLNPLRRAIGPFALGSGGLAFLFGCSFELFPSPGWVWYAPALSGLMLAFQRVPLWLYREPRLPKQAGAPAGGLALRES